MDAVLDSHAFASGAVVRLVRGDITTADVDVIVNAANAYLQHGGGVAGAISRRGGSAIQSESDEWVKLHGPITADQPALTSAGNLACRYVIHVVGPVWGEGDEDDKLSRAVTGALRLADDRKLGTLALPAVSTGIFGFPKERAAQVILGALAAYFDETPDTSLRRVDVNLFDGPTIQVFHQALSFRWPA